MPSSIYRVFLPLCLYRRSQSDPACLGREDARACRVGHHSLKAAPTVPTVAESGYPGFEASQWYGILVPVGTPKDIINVLNKEIVAALAGNGVRCRRIALATLRWKTESCHLQGV